MVSEDFLEATLGNLAVVSGTCGIGKVAAAATTAAAIERFEPSAVVLAGISGSLSAHAPLGAMVVVEAAIHHDFDCRPIAAREGQLPGRDAVAFEADGVLKAALADSMARYSAGGWSGPALVGEVCSGDQLVAEARARDLISMRFPDALCLDMETAAVAQVCEGAKVPWSALRMVSDQADESFSAQAVLSWCQDVAAPAMAEVVTGALGGLALEGRAEAREKVQ